LPYLFDTDAVSEILKRKPRKKYIDWLATIPREEQFTSAVVVGELYKGAFTCRIDSEMNRIIDYIENRMLPVISVIQYDVKISRVYGQITAHLMAKGRLIEDADLQIGATALFHGLDLVTGNTKHFERVPGLRICRALADA
jgi:predicted nucleic acid-binding protein